jgi:pyrroloquinoline quinone biosynthesis protein E
MPFDAYKRSLDQLFSLVEIKLQGVGEPLLHPRIFDMIKEASTRDIWTRVNVNGSLLKINDNYKRLIDSGPGEVQVSIDGSTKDVFERIRKGAQFEQIVENAALLNTYAKKQNVLKTRSWTVIQKDNFHQLSDIVRLGQKMSFKRMTFSIALSHWGVQEWVMKNKELDVDPSRIADTAEALVLLGKTLGVEVTFWDGSAKYRLLGEKKELCSWLFERAFISSDMRLVPCCVVADPGIVDFGDADDFAYLWNSGVYRVFRRQHMQGTIPAFCRQCYEE